MQHQKLLTFVLLSTITHMNRATRFLRRLKKKLGNSKNPNNTTSHGLPAFTHTKIEDDLKALAPRPFGALGQHGKVFVIGFNKTGTTSIGLALQNMGLKVAQQIRGEELIDNWANGNRDELINLCSTADVLQDVPFSLPNTYKILDTSFPDSKFILSVRNSPDQWYQSLIRYHSKTMGLDRIPTAEDLKAATYHSPGWMWRVCVEAYGADDQAPYDEARCTDAYLRHNKSVIEYFSSRPDALLVLNVSERDSLDRISKFIGLPCAGQVR